MYSIFFLKKCWFYIENDLRISAYEWIDLIISFHSLWEENERFSSAMAYLCVELFLQCDGRWKTMYSDVQKMNMNFVLIIYWFGRTFCVNGSVGDSESLHDVG